MLRTVAAAFFALAATAAAAQETNGPATDPEVRTSVLVIDQDRLLSESGFGERLSAELDVAAAALASENRQIEKALIEEEQKLTETRPDMSPEEFRAAADAFDEKVTRIRTEQDRKSRELTALRDREQRVFLDAALPVLGALLADYGAYVILDQRQVFLSDDRIDVTDEAIRRVDAALDALAPQPLDSTTPEQ